MKYLFTKIYGIEIRIFISPLSGSTIFATLKLNMKQRKLEDRKNKKIGMRY